MRKQNTYNFLPKSFHFSLVLWPYAHVPVYEHASTITIYEDVITTDVAMKYLPTLVRRTVRYVILSMTSLDVELATYLQLHRAERYKAGACFGRYPAADRSSSEERGGGHKGASS